MIQADKAEQKSSLVSLIGLSFGGQNVITQVLNKSASQ